MGVYRRAATAIAVVVVLALVAIGLGGSSGAVAAATVKRTPAPLISFFRPTGDTLVEKGTGPIRVIVHLRPGARLTKVEVDGVDLTRLLTRGPGGYWGAIVNVDRKLHYGYNDAFATAAGRDGGRATAHVRFIVAKRDDSLLRLTSFRIQSSAAPLQVALRGAVSVARGASVRVYVNDRRVDRAFSYEGGRLVVQLGAGEGLRFGRNIVQILVHRTHPYKRQSSYDIESRTVYVPRNAPIASAGTDQTVTQGDLVRFDGLATELPPGFPKPSFRWRIISAPRGSKAKLRNASSIRPTLVPDRSGRYDVRVSVRGAPRRPSGGPGARDASDTGSSSDTTTITVMPDIPPVGVTLDTLVPNRNASILLGGSEVSETPFNFTRINYAVVDRQTLQVAASGSVAAGHEGIDELAGIVDRYTGSLNYLVVLNWSEFSTDIGADRDAMDALLQKIGAQKLTPGQRREITTANPTAPSESGSAVGVAGAPAGSAFVKFSGRGNSTEIGGMSGYLRLNGVTGKYDFVFADAVPFDTEANQTSTHDSPAQLTVKVGDNTYTQPNPGGGVSGFHLVVLSANTLTPAGRVSNSVYVTNAADGAEQTDEVQRLVNDLIYGAYNDARPLVILQAYGAPHGNDAEWDEVAQVIAHIGGTRQVFDAMNTTDPRPLNDESANRKGPYAFVGRAGSTAPLAEASHSLNGLPGRLRGLLMRAHDGGYEPMIAGPPDRTGQAPVNTDLIRIADETTEAFPAFTDRTGHRIDAAAAEAVQRFLGDAGITGLCSPEAACEIRKSYYQDYNANWASIQDDLTGAKATCAKPHEGFTVDQCEGIRAELQSEVSMVAKVQQYFGPLGLQRPFGAAGVSALADLADISQTIRDAVEPPAEDHTTTGALDVLSEVLHIGAALSGTVEEAEAAETVIDTLSGAFGLTAYFTEPNGEPTLVGPEITTEASKLGVELQDRYLEAGNNLEDLGRLIVSDFGKLKAVASKVNSPPAPGQFDWRLGDIGQAQDALRMAAKRTIYERLVPLAYPVMYDLGEPDPEVGFRVASDWYCDGGLTVYNKRLFRDQALGAQFIGRFPSAAAAGWNPLIAVAQEHAVGNRSEAEIRGIPDSITKVLFGAPDQGGLGLSKLQFYSPRNGFRWFPPKPSPSSDGTLHVFPNTLGGSETGDRILCADVPDPPGNSG